MKTIHLKTITDLPLKNLARIIAMAMLKEHGEYTCKIEGIKHRFVLNR